MGTMMITDKIFRIAQGKALGECENKDISWKELTDCFGWHRVGVKAGTYFVGGSYSSKVRRDENMVDRSLLTLDIDDCGLTLSDLEYELLMGIDSAWLGYSTYSHGADAPKVRVIIPLSRPVSPAQYRVLSTAFVTELGIKCDPCSFKPNQVMYTPRCSAEADAQGNTWVGRGEGECLDVDLYLADGTSDGVSGGVSDGVFDLFNDDAVTDTAEVDAVDEAVKGLVAVVAAQPLDLSDEAVLAYLDAYKAEGSDYNEWLNVGMSLHHQYSGSEQGFNLWYSWSVLAMHEDEAKMRRKYEGFGGRGDKARTFASVIHSVNKVCGGLDVAVAESLRGVMTANSKAFDDLCAEASEVEDFEAYVRLKDKLLKISTVKMGGDLRAAIASELFSSIGKSKGMTKSDIKKAITPAGVAGGKLVEEGEVAEWAKEWVYIEMTRLFYTTKRNYGITKEAFNAKFDRMEECVASGMQASQLCLVMFKIGVVVDTIYWPGAGRTVTSQSGSKMLNSYRRQGVAPCAVLDAEGAEVVELFLKHLEHLIEDQVERDIVLNWMAFMYQNQGKRLNWSLVIQGTQGSGKSYIGNVMSLLLGGNVQALDTPTISGRFTSWATGAVLNIVEEIRISGTNKWGIMDKIKPYITNDQIICERKGRDVETLPNFTSYLLLTNHKDAIPIDEEDRRYCVIYSRLQTSEQLHDYFGGVTGVGTYFDALFDRSQERADALARFFTDYVIPDTFKPRGRAPYTESKSAMVDLAVSEHRDALDDLLLKYKDALINEDFVDISYLNMQCVLNGDEIPKTRSLSSIMLEKGYRPIKGRYFYTYTPQRKHYVWVKEGKTDEYAIEKVKEGLKELRLV